MSEGEKSLANKTVRALTVLAIAASGVTGGCAPKPSPSENTAGPAVSTSPSPESSAILALTQDKITFLTTLEKYLNLDADPQLKKRLAIASDEEFKVAYVNPYPQQAISPHTSYTFEGIQLSITTDPQGKFMEEILLINPGPANSEEAVKKNLNIQPPQWEPIGSVILNGKMQNLGKRAEFSTAEGYTRISLYEGGQLEIIFRTTPFPK